MKEYNIRGHDLGLLVVFVTLWDCRSVTRASERLALTQPAVSHALRRLREGLGDLLFVRGRDGLVPTPRAIELIGPVRESLERIDQALRSRPSFEPTRARRVFRIAANDFLEFAFLPQLFERLGKAAPGISIKIVPIPESAELPQLLEQNAIDLVLAAPSLSLPGLKSHQLAEIPGTTMIWTREGLPPGRFPLDLFVKRSHVVLDTTALGGSFIDQMLASQGLARNFGAVAQNILTMPAIAARTGLICTIPQPIGELFANVLGLSSHEPPFKLPAQHLTAYWHPRFDADPALIWLREQVRATAESWPETGK